MEPPRVISAGIQSYYNTGSIQIGVKSPVPRLFPSICVGSATQPVLSRCAGLPTERHGPLRPRKQTFGAGLAKRQEISLLLQPIGQGVPRRAVISVRQEFACHADGDA